jgi:excinuclease UvrABC nuclease subunit
MEDGPGLLDTSLAALPAGPAVFLILAGEGRPYLGKTTMLPRRLGRLLGPRPAPSKILNLRSVATRVEYRPTASRLETSLVLYAAARQHYPETYVDLIRLRMPPYVKIVLSNAFPRSHVTTRLSDSHGFYYGPFRARAAAEQFENRFLDLFQMRRCQENLEPSTSHPGCMYGEMNLCLRPCQMAVSAAEYASEVERARQFLSTGGRSLSGALLHARDRLSQEMNFEEAARLHKQLEKVQEVLKLRDELAGNIDDLNGLAVTRSVAPGCVELWFMLGGCWQAPRRFAVEAAGAKSESLDRRLREIAAELHPESPWQGGCAPLAQRPCCITNGNTVNRVLPERVGARERQEHLALLARWFYSSYRDGEWIPFAGLEDIPYRKLVRAISRQGQWRVC